jgi:GNAT superfamily N-acetyltransferase
LSVLRIVKLERSHAVEPFDCGSEPLNRYLQHHALANHASGAGRTYVALSGSEVIGYYTLAASQADYADAPERLVKGMARHPVPLMLLARLAVARHWQGKRVGRGLLLDAMRRTLMAADIAGIRALEVHAKDEEARRFYERFDFAPSPTDRNHLFLLIKDIRESL